MSHEAYRLARALEPLVYRCRTDVTARKSRTQGMGSMLWTREAITAGRLAAHVEGRIGRGVCPIREGESVCQVAVFDLDDHKGDTPVDVMLGTARKISDRLFFEGLHAHAFTSSGGKGIHLYLMWDLPQDAYSVRRFLFDVLAGCGFKSGTGGVNAGEIEVFPKQDQVPMGGFGSQFILPLFNASVPLDLSAGQRLDREAVCRDDFWVASAPVPVLTKVVRLPRAISSTGEWVKYVEYMTAVDPDCGYDDWFRIAQGLHFESEGSEDAFMAWDDWSSSGGSYPGTEALYAKWLSIRGDSPDPVTGQSIIVIARKHSYGGDYAADFDNEVDLTAFEQLTTRFEGGEVYVDAGATGTGVGAGVVGGGANVIAAANAANAASAAAARVFTSLPRVKRNKNAEIEAVKENVFAFLNRPDLTKCDLRFDAFRAEIVMRTESGWRAFGDDDYFELAMRLEKDWGFRSIPKELIRDAVSMVANVNRFDSAVHWLESLPAWDGQPRIDSFFPVYLSAEDNAYTRSVGSYLWTGLAARVLSPGCQLDMVPILEGAQGARKTSAVKALVPTPEQYCVISFGEKDDDLARKMRGRLVAEIGELRGLHTRELETIKEFITRTDELWVPKFKEFGASFARRLMFIGTTNQDEILADETGNRRWLPVHVGLCDVDAIVRDRVQLWAEARLRYQQNGVEFKTAETLAAAVHEHYLVQDSWGDVLDAWLYAPGLDGVVPFSLEYLRIHDVLRDVFAFDTKQVKRTDELRLGKLLRARGYSKRVRRIEGRNVKAWVKD